MSSISRIEETFVGPHGTLRRLTEAAQRAHMSRTTYVEWLRQRGYTLLREGDMWHLVSGCPGGGGCFSRRERLPKPETYTYPVPQIATPLDVSRLEKEH